MDWAAKTIAKAKLIDFPLSAEPYLMYYQLTPHKSTMMGFSVAFECLQSFLHTFLNAKTCFDVLQPSQSGKPEIGQILKFLIFSSFFK